MSHVVSTVRGITATALIIQNNVVVDPFNTNGAESLLLLSLRLCLHACFQAQTRGYFKKISSDPPTLCFLYY